jgi:hypothetical protein
MSNYGERLTSRPSYQHYQTAFSTLNEERSRRSSPVASRSARHEAHLSDRSNFYPKNLSEEVLWRQRRFAWWGSTNVANANYIACTAVKPVSAVYRDVRRRPQTAQKCRLILNMSICVFCLQGVLVQEIDEGRPCLTCTDQCPGFQPHPWR